MCVPLILERGTEELRAAWIPGLASGEQIAVSAAIGTPVTGALEGDNVVLDAAIDGVSGGIYAGLSLTAVEIEGVARALLVPMTEDLTTCRLVVDSLAARDAGQADVVVQGTVSVGNLLTCDGAVEQVRRDLDLWAGVLGVAAARAVLGLTVDYVRERQVFGRPLVEFENTQHVLAEVYAGIESAQLFVDACLAERSAGTLTPARAAMARLAASSVHDRSVDQGMQLHGGYGYMREYPISHAFADARYLRTQSAIGSNALVSVVDGMGL